MRTEQLRIGIDARPIQGSFTGDATYWRGLVDGLSRFETFDDIIVYLDADLPEPEIMPSGYVRVRYLSAVNWRAWTAWAFPQALREDKVQVAHVQYGIPPLLPCPVITTVHDVSFKRHPEFFRLKDRLILDTGMKHLAKNAARILTVSEYSRKEMLELYNIPYEKIAVVYLGVDKQYKPMDRGAAQELVRTKYGIRAPFIVTVSVIQPRKNIQGLLEGFAKLKGIQHVEHKLVIVGKYGWKEHHLSRRIRDLDLTSDVIFTGYVPYEDLPAFYNAADLFVYPSVYEGFGLPPLEAMACGAPVITGNRSSLPEVVDEAGIMVDPYDSGAFAVAMSNVLSSEALRAEMSNWGLAQSRKFSWDEMARHVLSIYHEVGREFAE